MRDFKEVMDVHHPILYKIGRAYADQEDFEDLYQEMLINLWKSLPNFRGDSKLSTWIYRVTLNTALTYKRNKRRKHSESVDFENFLNTWSANDEDAGVREREIQRLYFAIKQLKKEERSVILLYLDEKSYEEMADILGLTTSNVGVKINRIKKKLYNLLKR
ncbi:MAG: RNA polymerase sigma factor [Bacteroidales bacterium]